MENQIKIWHNFLDEKIKSKRVKASLKDYVEKILLNNSVVVFEFTHLSQLLGIEKDYLSRIVFNPKYFYHSFTIPKRNGTLRTIDSPSDVLLYIQRWIYNNILKNVKLDDNCMGFRAGYSIKNNVDKHLHKNIILKMDLKDFFPSICKKRVISVFRNIGYSPKISFILASLCTLEDKLPQGVPTSPYLSNIIAKRLDIRLKSLCKKFDLQYTRYADDITISGNSLPKKIINYIEEIVKNEGFEVNEKKTRLLYKNNRRIITGISISSNKLTIPKKNKRDIRQSIFYIKQFGISNHLKKKKITDPIYLERLLGYLYFWKFVEPESQNVKEYISIVKSEIENKNLLSFELKEKKFEFVG
jgi:hypothetical protein